MAPNTGNEGADNFIAKTFLRETKVNGVTGETEQLLRIKPIPYETVLSQDQMRGLIYYLRTTFCGACGGTGFESYAPSVRCSYCSDMPF